MTLIELVEKQADDDLEGEMLDFTADHIMEAEGVPKTGAARAQASPMREVKRNGYPGYPA